MSQDPPRKDENSQKSKQPKLGHKKRNGSRWHENRNTDKRRKREILGPDDYTRIDVPQVQAGADIEKLHAQPSSPAVRHSDNSSYASGTWAPTKDRERMVQSTQRKMLRLIIQTKRRNKKIVKHKVKTSEDSDNIDSSCTDDESEDGQSSVSQNEDS